MLYTRQSSSEGWWLHTEKAQGSFGVLMYSIVIISTEFYKMDFSLYISFLLCLGIVVIIIINMNMIILILILPFPPPVLSGYWTIQVFCIAV